VVFTSAARVAASVDAFGNIDTSTSTRRCSGKTRSAATIDGSAFWIGCGGVASGVVYIAHGASAANESGVDVTTSATDTRVVSIFAGQLYGSNSAGNYYGVYTVGVGTPTGTGNVLTLLPGMSSTSGPDPTTFFMADMNTNVVGNDVIYLGDARGTGGGGGIQKWTFDGAVWTLVKTFNNGIPAGVRGVAGYRTATSVTLFATTDTSTGGNRLVKLVDDGSPNPTFTTLVTAATNTTFAGVALSPY
jgi:hypothetical protein